MNATQTHPTARATTSLPRGRIRRPALLVGLALTFLLGLAPAVLPAQAKPPPPTASSTAVMDWGEAAGRAAVAACLAPENNPLHEVRMYAMSHLAIHDALNSLDRRAESYASTFRAEPGANPDAAVAAAARATLVSVIAEIPEPFAGCRGAATDVVEDYYVDRLAMIPEGKAKQRGLAAGQRAAEAVIAARVGDGTDTPLIVADYPQGTAPGEWRFTAGTGFAFAPGWGEVTPFAITSADQFRTASAAELDSGRYTRDFAEVKALGGDGVTTPTARTAEQTEIALFWVESSPMMWNKIARELARSHDLDTWEQARLLGQLNAALFDGYVASFDKKYDESFWRPETAIQLAADDGNRRTTPDPTWTPLRTTPPIPDHDSAHAVEGGAAAGVMRSFFGTPRLSFSVCSETLPDRSCSSADPKLRSFDSITEAAHENAYSRVLVGFHFRHASEIGNRHGLRIGQWTASSILQPVRHR